MKALKSLIIVALVYCGQMLAMSPLQARLKAALGVRTLIIIFDPENAEGYVEGGGCQTLTALWTKLIEALRETDGNTPVVTTLDLCKNFAQCPSMFLLDQWDVYTTRDNNLVIFIPKADKNIHLKKLSKDFSQHEMATYTISALSLHELLVGVKINRLQKVPAPIAKNILNLKKTNVLDKENLKKYLQAILVNSDNFINQDTQFLNRWDIYLTGHAYNGTKIAGISVDYFKSLLDFLNAKINTRSLFYDTCFAGGKNLQAPYHNENQEKTLNFMVISATTFFATTMTSFTDAQYTSMTTIVPRPVPSAAIINFKTYFTELDQYFKSPAKKRKPLGDIIEHVTEWKKTFDTYQNTWLNIPAVRYPHTQWFSVTEVDEKVFRINDRTIISAIYEGKNEIVVPADVEMILVETVYIPIPIVIKGNYIPLIIPQDITGQSYLFKEIRAPDCAIGALVTGNAFETMIQRLFEKAPTVGQYYIETLIIKVENQKMLHGAYLTWSNQALMFHYVIIGSHSPHSPRPKGLWVQYGGSNTPFKYDIFKKYWEFISYYEIYHEMHKIKTESTLPESMKGPYLPKEQPFLYKTLVSEYLKHKDNPQQLEQWISTLSPEDKQRLKRFRGEQTQKHQKIRDAFEVACKKDEAALLNEISTGQPASQSEIAERRDEILQLAGNDKDLREKINAYINQLYNIFFESPSTADTPKKYSQRAKEIIREIEYL